MHILHNCDATWYLMQRTMEPYLHHDLRDCPAPGREKGNNHVGRNRQLPPRLEALQREPERALPARRPRIGRYRHHPIGHPADRVGDRSPRARLTHILRADDHRYEATFQFARTCCSVVDVTGATLPHPGCAAVVPNRLWDYML